MQPIRRALLSVSDQSGLAEFARALAALGVELLSTGGTARALREAGVAVREVADYTGFPEILDGRVKTLHPKIHGALLGRRGQDDAAMAAHGIEPIDLLAVNLYPFEATAAKAEATLEQIIENIDVGGPAMLRAAAKNHAAVTVVVDPLDYPRVIEEMRVHGNAVSAALRRALAVKAFAHTAAYDGTIANYLCAHRAGESAGRPFPDFYTVQYHKRCDLRYGENPHQRAALYAERGPLAGTLAGARQLQGKELSYNNLADADAALACVTQFETPACVIVKHANPCGAALGNNLVEAYARAYACDPEAAFGGILAFNRELDAATAAAVIEGQFAEVLLAPAVTAEAGAELGKKPKLRVLVTGPLRTASPPLEGRPISGGLLLQEPDRGGVQANDLRTVTRRQPDGVQLADLLFAWRVAKYVKSNAIVCARAGQSLGIGAGQPSRVMSARLAVLKAAEAGFELRGAVMASDAFFPFRDSVDIAARAGIAAIIQPGGSVRDPEVIGAADEHGLAMVFTGMRHFRH